ncbi:MAG: non-homologous end-joining DNA ligase [Firmicutes bacterium]|nr:non-homologous end-joining DNA ligase [Bacillota bacterium]
MKISNPDKIVYQKTKTTKQDVVDYYNFVEKMMLPYISNRNLALVRCPGGVTSCFYTKNPPEFEKNFFVVSDTAELISHVQMNTIEFHLWGSPSDDIDLPDIMVFDLDPDETMSLKQIRKGATDLKSILDELGLVSFLKTSGGKGYHIVVPFKEASDWSSFKEFSKMIAELMEAKWQDKYTTNIRKDARGGKIFVDYLRNTKGATSIAPYSLRAKESPTISFPIDWHEINKFKPNSVDINNIEKYIQHDPWKDFFKVKNKQKLKS